MLVQGFARTLAERYQVAADFSLHAPSRHGDQRNHHAHILTTTREITAAGLGAKSVAELSDTDRRRRGLSKSALEIEWIRDTWGKLTNRALEQAYRPERVDHRSLENQGIQREPTWHKGPAITAMERRGIEPEVSWRIREEANERLALAAKAGVAERREHELLPLILDTETELAAAIAERDEAFKEQLRHQAHDAMARWRERQKTPQPHQQPEHTKSAGIEYDIDPW